MALTVEKPVVRAILEYLAEHPDAQDTLDGIVEWWLLARRIQQTRAEVRDALAELVALKFVRERHRRDGRTCYCLNREMEPRVRALLETAHAPKTGRGRRPMKK